MARGYFHYFVLLFLCCILMLLLAFEMFLISSKLGCNNSLESMWLQAEKEQDILSFGFDNFSEMLNPYPILPSPTGNKRIRTVFID